MNEKASKKQMMFCRSLGYEGEVLTKEEASAYIDAHRKPKKLPAVNSAAEYVAKYVKFYITIDGKKIECKNYLSLSARYGKQYTLTKPKTIVIMLKSHGFYKTFLDDECNILLEAYLYKEEREYIKYLK